MSVNVTLALTLTTIETITENTPAATDANSQVTHNQFNVSETLTGTTDTPVSKCAYFEQALSSGTATIDLTNLSGTNGGTIDGTGLKVQCFLATNKSTNENSITISKGASNGYGLGGDSWSHQLEVGQSILIYGNESADDISGSAKTIDLSGTGTEILQVGIVMG